MATSPLSEALRAAGRKRNLTLRPIYPTQAQTRALAKLYYAVVDVWAVGVRERILPEYARSLSQLTTDAPADLEYEISVVDEGAVRATFDFRWLFDNWAFGLTQWHLDRLASQLTYATNVELTSQLGPATDTVADFLARNTALVRNVSDQTRGRIADIVFRGLQARTPVRDVAKEINAAVGLGRARSLRIASDQTAKLSGALDAQRGQQLGFRGYRWKHSAKLHYRPEHLARNGDFFAFGSEVDRNDPPGQAPFCGCKRMLSDG